MGCACIQKLQLALENLKKLPLAALMELIPDDLPTAQMGRLSAGLMGTAHASASAQARLQVMAKLAASARLSASLNMNAVAKLEAMAQMSQALGVSPFSANASARLGLAIQSMNQNFPPLMAMLLDLLAPFAEKLAALAAMLSTTAVVKQTIGLNLASPAAAAKLSAALQAHASAAASLSAKVSAAVSANATMNLAAHLRLVAAASALGINVLAPGGIAKLSAALNVSAKLALPALAIDLGKMGSLAAALGQISAARTALNMKFMMPNAASHLAAMLGPLLAAMKVVAKLNLSAKMSASASASASAAASASATARASMKAAAAFNFRAMLLPPIPDFGKLALAATLSEQLSLGLGVSPMQRHSCSSCPVAGMF